MNPDNQLAAELAAIAEPTSVVSLLLEVWDEAIARGAGPEVFERLAEHLVSVIPHLDDSPTAALAAEAVTTAYSSLSEPWGDRWPTT